MYNVNVNACLIGIRDAGIALLIICSILYAKLDEKLFGLSP